MLEHLSLEVLIDKKNQSIIVQHDTLFKATPHAQFHRCMDY